MVKMKRKICVVTGTRAEYGLLRWVIEGIQKSHFLQLQLLATGMHLSPEFGLTIKNIEADGFHVDHSVEMLLSSDTSVGVTKSIGLGLIGFADAFSQLQPDCVLVLGDRYEIFAAASAAMIARLPIAHLHGGEATEGLIDEAIRHSITKMSHIHFVAADEYRRRVIQLGEDPSFVFTVGGLGIDSICRLKLLPKHQLEQELDFQFRSKNMLITFHPVTLENNTSEQQIDELLMALADLQDTGLIFTMPNSDTDGRLIFDKIDAFCSTRPNAQCFTSLGQLKYLSSMKYVDAVVGNSSSGLLEAPSFNIGTINIGDRQRGRLIASSVIECEPYSSSISDAIKKLYSSHFQQELVRCRNPYGNGGASQEIVRRLELQSFDNLLKKKFYDILV